MSRSSSTASYRLWRSVSESDERVESFDACDWTIYHRFGLGWHTKQKRQFDADVARGEQACADGESLAGLSFF